MSKVEDGRRGNILLEDGLDRRYGKFRGELRAANLGDIRNYYT